MSEFYYREADHIIGPISGATLKSLCQRGEISPSTDIRKNDGAWMPAGQVKGLAELFTLETAKVVMVPHRQPTADIDGRGSAKQTSTTNASISAELLPGEEVLFKGRPLFWRGFPLAAFMLVIAMPSSIVILRYLFPSSLWIAFIPALLIAFVCGLALRYVWTITFEVTTLRTVWRSRGISKRQQGIWHRDVNEVTTSRRLEQRPFRTGQLTLKSSANPYRLVISGIHRPDRIAEEIRRRMAK